VAVLDLAGFILLAAAALLGGAVNAIAGGGGILVFSALLLAGLSPIVATATTAVGLFPSNLAAAIVTGRGMLPRAGALLALLVPAVLGGCCGTLLLLATGSARFTMIVPWLLLMATIGYAAAPAVVRRFAGVIPPAMKLAVVVLVSLYGGFFNAGMGIVILAGLALVSRSDVKATNAEKNAVAAAVPVLGIVLLFAARLVDWPAALVVALLGAVGAWLGGAFATLVPPAVLRAVVLVVAAGVTEYAFFHPD
jgi:uncharacterized membrane protein YfcA